MPLAAGTTLSFYEILAPLGAGAMGEVYRAKDTRLGREVAIKVLPEHFAAENERLQRFEREASTLASLNHPNVAQIFGVDQDDDLFFLVLELVPGESLDERLKRGPLPLDEALDVAQQIAEGLESAHEAGVIHRDLKPANVLVTPDGRVKVVDFGLAKPANRESDGSSTDSVLATEAGRLLGTPTYMAPEQARGKPIDKRVDIWAFGCVLFECLTAKRAFPGETLPDILAAVIDSEPNWANLPPTTPVRVRDLLVRCFEKDPRVRLRDIGEARLLLADPATLSGPSNPSTTSPQRSHRAWLPWMLTGALVLLALSSPLWSPRAPRGSIGAEPTFLNVEVPAEIKAEQLDVTRDGRTMLALGRRSDSSGSGTEQKLVYVRRNDGYEFEPLVGTEGAIDAGWTQDGRSVVFLGPSSPGSVQFRLAIMPIDGSAPPTTLTDWGDRKRYRASWAELPNGDFLVADGDRSYVRLPKSAGAPTAPIQIVTGREDVRDFILDLEALPGDHGVLTTLVSLDSAGFHYHVGVLEPSSGRVKVIVEDGANAAYSPTGHLLFARGTVILAAPFDLDTLELGASPVAVLDGLDTRVSTDSGKFRLTDRGTLAYRSGGARGNHALALLMKDGKLQPWPSERKSIWMPPRLSPDGSRLLFSIDATRNSPDSLWVSPVDHADFFRVGTGADGPSLIGVWSPDSQSVAYNRVARDDLDGIYVRDLDGGVPRRILERGNRKNSRGGADEWLYPTEWLPDNTALLMDKITGAQREIVLLPMADALTDATPLRRFRPSDDYGSRAEASRDGKLIAFRRQQTGKIQSWVAVMAGGEVSGRPIVVRTDGSSAHQWGTDDNVLFVEDLQRRLMKITVEGGSPLSVSAPVEVADLDKLGIRFWTPLEGERFFVVLDDDKYVKHFNIIQNWTEVLRGQVPVGK